MNTLARAAIVTALTLPINGLIYAPTAHATPGCVSHHACHERTDIRQGIRDGIDAIEEDSPAWSCVDDGNRVCGPNNAEGKPAACYDDGGVIVAYWPCSPWKSDN